VSMRDDYRNDVVENLELFFMKLGKIKGVRPVGRAEIKFISRIV